MKKKVLFAIVIICLISTFAFAGDWGSWDFLDYNRTISWRVKCTGDEWKIEFRNNTDNDICVDYDIVDGYGGQKVQVPAHSKKLTYANYRNEGGCEGSLNINYELTNGSCY